MAMMKHFRESEIQEFRECFYLHAGPTGSITKVSQLGNTMRSLGLSPTIIELRQYLKDKDGKIQFAQLLEIMHEHRRKEKIPDDIIEWFYTLDPKRTGRISGPELQNKLIRYGEKLSPREAEQFFRLCKLDPKGMIRYDQIIQFLTTPLPDY